LALQPAAFAQTAPAQPHIQDNSFLLEEAYNQEAGVVQHISSLTRFWDSKDWTYSFTQEWPVPRHPRHQISFTVAGVRNGDFIGHGVGLGDLALHYRYQLVGAGNRRLAIAPRLSALLPTGNPRLGRGFGGAGVQLNLPLSLVLVSRLATHVNAGVTLIPRARQESGARARVTGFNLGQSFVYDVHPRFNLMLETLWTSWNAAAAPDTGRRVNDVFVSPGVRWAYNFSSGLQIVPGLAVPIRVGPGARDRGLLLYLSFEHRMWHE